MINASIKTVFSKSSIVIVWLLLSLPARAQTTTIDMVLSYGDTFDNTVAKQGPITLSVAAMGVGIFQATNGAHRLPRCR